MSSHEPELRDMFKTIEQEKEIIEVDVLSYDPDKIDDIYRLSEELYTFFTLALGGGADHQRGLRGQWVRVLASHLQG
eukprot:4606616-Heterocapsa_arctica.AAC.1